MFRGVDGGRGLRVRGVGELLFLIYIGKVVCKFYLDFG